MSLLACALMFTGAISAGAEEVNATVETEVEYKMMQGRPLDFEMQKRMEVKADILKQRGEMKTERGVMMEERTEMMEKRGEKMEDRQERREEMIKKFDEKTASMRLKFQEQFAKKSLRASAQIEHLIGRFETLLAKMKAGGKNTAEAEASLAVSKTALATAKIKIDALKALYPTDGSELSAEAQSAARVAKAEAEQAIKAVHESLRKLMSLVKGLSTATPATTASVSGSAQVAQ